MTSLDQLLGLKRQLVEMEKARAEAEDQVDERIRQELEKDARAVVFSRPSFLRPGPDPNEHILPAPNGKGGLTLAIPGGRFREAIKIIQSFQRGAHP